MAKTSDTSITKTDAVKFTSLAKPSRELSCQKLKGFHLVKTQKGSTWRFRYTDFAGSRRKINLGKFVDGSDDRMGAVDLVMKYRGQLSQGIDPAKVIDERKATFKKESNTRNTRLLSSYLSGPYTKHQALKKDNGKHTLELIERAFKGLLATPMNEINDELLKSWQESYKYTPTGGTRAHSTIVRSFGALRTMLRHAVRNKVLETDPTSSFKLEEESANEKAKRHDGTPLIKRRMLTVTELSGINLGLDRYRQQFIDKRENTRSHGNKKLPSFINLAHPHWFFPFFRLAAYSGMRPGDLYSLNWRELNVNFRRLVKVPSKSRHHSNPSKLDLPLDETITKVMKSWYEQIGSPSNGLVFPSPVTGGQMDKKAHVKHWKAVLRLGNVGSEIDFYSLRHHYISKLVAGGIPLFTVAKLAGHKSIKMIEEHYGHLAPNAAAEALSLISGDFSQTENKKWRS